MGNFYVYLIMAFSVSFIAVRGYVPRHPAHESPVPPVSTPRVVYDI